MLEELPNLYPGKPFAVVETGWNTSARFASSEAQQTDFVRLLRHHAERSRAEFIDLFILQDGEDCTQAALSFALPGSNPDPNSAGDPGAGGISVPLRTAARRRQREGRVDLSRRRRAGPCPSRCRLRRRSARWVVSRCSAAGGGTRDSAIRTRSLGERRSLGSHLDGDAHLVAPAAERHALHRAHVLVVAAPARARRAPHPERDRWWDRCPSSRSPGRRPRPTRATLRYRPAPRRPFARARVVARPRQRSAGSRSRSAPGSRASAGSRSSDARSPGTRRAAAAAPLRPASRAASRPGS